MQPKTARTAVLLLAVFAFLGCERASVNGPSETAATDTEAGSLLPKQPSPGIRVSFTYLDDPSDNIVSDERGPYIDGVGGVTAYINPSTNDMILDPGFRTGNIKDPRSVDFDFTDPVDPADTKFSVLGSRGFLNVDGSHFPPGWDFQGSMQTFAQFNVGGGNLRFSSNYLGAFEVSVTRDGEAWTVGTRPLQEDVGAFVKKDGIGKHAEETVTLYHMPFKITVVPKP